MAHPARTWPFHRRLLRCNIRLTFLVRGEVGEEGVLGRLLTILLTHRTLKRDELMPYRYIEIEHTPRPAELKFEKDESRSVTNRTSDDGGRPRALMTYEEGVDAAQAGAGVRDLRARLMTAIEEGWKDEVWGRLGVAGGVSGEDGASDRHFALFLDYVLCTDMRHYWVAREDGAGPAVVPAGDASGRDNTDDAAVAAPDRDRRPWFVQIERVEDISQPCTRRYVPPGGASSNGGGGSTHARMLKLLVFDGRRHHTAIEHQPMSFASGWPRLGSKLVIDPDAVVRDGVVMLTPSTCGVLGGAVEEFERRQKIVEEVLMEPVYGRRGGTLGLEAWRGGVAGRVKEKVGDQDVGALDVETARAGDCGGEQAIAAPVPALRGSPAGNVENNGDINDINDIVIDLLSSDDE